MKKLLTIFLVLFAFVSQGQISDALTQDTIDLWITPNLSKSITATKMNTILSHLNLNKIHKDSIDVVGHWTLTGNDIANNNSGKVTLDSAYITTLNVADRVGHIMHWNHTTKEIEFITPAALGDTIAVSGGGPWTRDTVNKYIYPTATGDNILSTESIIDTSATNSIAFGDSCVIDTMQQRGQNVYTGEAFGKETKVYDWWGTTMGAYTIADGKIAHAQGNTSMCSANDSYAEGNRTVAGRRRYWSTVHGVGSSTGVTNKAYIVVPITYGRVDKFFPSALTPLDSIVTYYGAGATRDKKGNIYPSGMDSATYNLNGTVNTYNDLQWAMHSFCVVKGSTESEIGFYRILKATHSAVNGDTIFYDADAEPYADILAIYSSYAATVIPNGGLLGGGNGQHAEGLQTSTWGYGSHAEGWRTNAWGQYSHSQNGETQALGNFSTAMGYYTVADSYGGVVMGRYNIGGGTSSSWVATDYLLECGNGADAANKANAFSVLKNGTVTVGNTLEVPLIKLPATTSSALGVIRVDNVNFFHAYGTNNVFSGSRAGNFTLTGAKNTGHGVYAGYVLSTGADNTLIGYYAGVAVQGGLNNTFIGSEAGSTNVSGNNNTYVGYLAGKQATGSSNVLIGEEAGYTITDGHTNTVVGYRAGEACTSGDRQVWLGANAGTNAAFATLNDVGGIDVSTTATPLLYFDFAKDSVFVNGALDVTETINIPTTSATVGQVKVNGTRVLHFYGTNNTFLGGASGNFTLTTGSALSNTGLSALTLASLTTGSANTAAGVQAGRYITEGSSNTLYGSPSGIKITTGNYNTGVGGNTLGELTTTSNNTALGYNAGNNATGTGNVFVGYSAGSQQTTGDSKLYIDNSNTTTPLIGGDFAADKVTITGDLTYTLRHAKLTFSDSSRAILITQNVYTKITNAANTLWGSIEASNVTFAGDSITIVTPGDYAIWFNLDGTGAGTNDVYKYRLYKDGVAVAGGPTSKGTIAQAGWTWYIEDCVAGTDLAVRVTNTADNDDLTVENGSIYIRKEHD